MMKRSLAFSMLVVLSSLSMTGAASPTDWPGFRGHGAAGVADASKLPTTWSATANVLWSSEIPGRGWSSPIVWRDRVYVTSAVNSGAFKQPATGIYGNDLAAKLTKQGLPPAEVNARVIARDIELASEVEDVRYVVSALDSATGKVVWEREAHKGKPAGGRHRKNTYASETPMTDGERIYASFGGNVGLFCYAMDGGLLWSHKSDPQPIYLDFGTASSPVLHGGRVYLQRDSEAASSLTALDAKTGREIWKVDRTPLSEGSRMKSGWATPFVWETPGRTEIVTIGKSLVVSYSVDGKELWRLKGMTQATPTPVAGGGLLFVGSGSQGEANRPMYAIKPGASGDITSTDPLHPSIAWFQPRLSAYTGSPLFYRGRLYVVNDNGVMQVVNAATGAEVYKVRVGGTGNTFSSSPFASDGRIYVVTEDGDTIVFEAGDEYREIARNSLGEMSLASPAANGDSLFIRTQTKLFRVGTRSASR